MIEVDDLINSRPIPAHRNMIYRIGVFSLISVVLVSTLGKSPFNSINDGAQNRELKSSYLVDASIEAPSASVIETLGALWKALTPHPKKRTSHIIKRIAVVRPFAFNTETTIPTSFEVWKDYPPCQYDRGPHNHTTVDVFLSFSRSFESSPAASQSLKKVRALLKSGKSTWARCIGNVYGIDANIPSMEDIYAPANAADDVMWVNGPNRQFGSIMDYFHPDDAKEKYDLVYIMEADSVPRKSFWLDALLLESKENAPFAILGSKYDGDSWDDFQDRLPHSLLHHINGNAVYNTSHPYLHLISTQLKSEADTLYNSVPYDYRISQIVYEGSHGYLPEIQRSFFKKVKNANKRKLLNKNTEKFDEWWETFGGQDPLKESSVISNFAATNLLPRHMNDAFIVHGAKHYVDWDPQFHDITLVISEWHDGLSSLIISDIATFIHPFQQITLMVPSDLSPASYPAIPKDTQVPIHIQTRTLPDYMDICQATITTEWFMITNAFHGLSEHIDILFDPISRKSVVPFTPADRMHCFNHPGCVAMFKSAKKIYKGMEIVVQDSDILFQTFYRNEFCDLWKKKNTNSDKKEEYEEFLFHSKKSAFSLGPTATSYLAFLFSRNMADEIYAFTDRTSYGARDNFKKVFRVEEEYHQTSSVSDQYQRFMQGDAPASSPTNLNNPPTQAPVKERERFRCKSWCAYIPIAWWDDSGEGQKCDWMYSCGHCDECYEDKL